MVPSEKPFERPQNVDISKNLVFFYTKRLSAVLYFTKRVKLYVDGAEKNLHVATPATDIVFSVAENLAEATRKILEVLQVDYDVGTFLDIPTLKKSDLEEYIMSYQGSGIYFGKNNDARLLELGRKTGKVIAGNKREHDLNVSRKWKILDNDSNLVVLQMLDLKTIASRHITSPVFLTNHLPEHEVRAWIEPEMKKSLEDGFPPVAAPLFYYAQDPYTWQSMDFLMFSEGFMFLPSLNGEVKRLVRFPPGKWRELGSGAIFKDNQVAPTNSLFLRENWAVESRKDGRCSIVSFISSEFERILCGRKVKFSKEKLVIEDGNESDVWEIKLWLPHSLKEISLKVNKGGREVRI